MAARSAKILAENCQKIKGPQVATTTCGPDNKEVNHGSDSRTHDPRSRIHHFRLQDDGRDPKCVPNPVTYEVAGGLTARTRRAVLVDIVRPGNCEVNGAHYTTVRCRVLKDRLDLVVKQ